MYRKTTLCAAIMFMSLGFAANIQLSDVRLAPRLLNYQGYLTDTQGNPITNPSVSMTFAIFDAASAGNQKWSENQASVAIDKGIFNVLLGSVAPIPDSVFTASTARYLELTVAGQTLSPRTRIVSAPYAYTATYSDTALYAKNTLTDNDWTLKGNVLYTADNYAIAKSGDSLYGGLNYTHVNLGLACTTGTSSSQSEYCTVGGGAFNAARISYSTVAGGSGNTATDEYGVVGGGHGNTAGYYATVGGGENNHNAGDYSVIAGGYADTITANGDFSYLYGINSNLTQDSTFMVDIPHIRFGNEATGYEFPTSDGVANQVMITNGSGQLAWDSIPGGADNDWTYLVSDGADTTLQMGGRWGLARVGNMLYGNADSTHVNLGTACATGTSGFNNKYCTVTGGRFNSAKGQYASVSGGYSNSADSAYTAIGGGYGNYADGYIAYIGGGYINAASGAYATVSGGYDNYADGYIATVSGGYQNNAHGVLAAIGGGNDNTINGNNATIGGGSSNMVSNNYGVVGGGQMNAAAGYYSIVGGGGYNYVAGDNSAIIGGYADTITAAGDFSYLFGINSNLTQDSTFMVDMPHVWFGAEATGYEFPRQRGSNGQVLGTDATGHLSWRSGDNYWFFRITDGADTTLQTGGKWGLARAGNFIYGACDSTHVNLGVWSTTGTSGINYKYCTVAGGFNNIASSMSATIGGGERNTASGSYATVAGGRSDSASGDYATVAGGGNNSATGVFATVAGGNRNTARGYHAIVGGGYSNHADTNYASVNGGHMNIASGEYATVGGGDQNTGSGFYATVSGGRANHADTIDAAIGGGSNNNASGAGAFVGGGNSNDADGDFAAVAGGWGNVASGNNAIIGGGYNNQATGDCALVSGGYSNLADTNYASVIGGYTNTASGYCATVSGGLYNTNRGNYSTVGGGSYNTASGDYATIAGGWLDTCLADYGFATNGSTKIGVTDVYSAAFTTSHTIAANQVRAAAFSTGTIDFAMDHPADPANKILNQYGVSSNEVQSQYSGSVMLDASGKAIVALPDYFEDINRNPRIQLTGVGSSDVYVAEKIKNNRFVVGGKSGIEVYWEVTAERKDIHAEIARIQTPVMQEKKGDLRGHSIDDDAMIGIYDGLHAKNPELFQFKTEEGRNVHEQSKKPAGGK